MKNANIKGEQMLENEKTKALQNRCMKQIFRPDSIQLPAGMFPACSLKGRIRSLHVP
jgi:CRISPR/Cas system CSM-associated protein Csm3 (group 7 of RAMP superfamily)